MNSFRFIGSTELYYPTLGITALPGQCIDLPGEAPADGYWMPVTPGAATVTVPAVSAPVAAPVEPAPAPAPAPAVEPAPAPVEPAPVAPVAPEVTSA